MTSGKTTKARRGARPRAATRRVGPRAAKRRSTRVWAGIGAVVLGVTVAAVLFSQAASAGLGDVPSARGSVSIDRAPGPVLAAGETIPAWVAPSLAGGDPVRWSDRPSGPTVLAVWAPWCPHCQAELPRLSAALVAHRGIGLTTIVTAIGDKPGPTPRDYLDAKGLSFPAGIDDVDHTLGAALGVVSYPTTYYVASDGTVVTSTIGEVDPATLESILSDLETR